MVANNNNLQAGGQAADDANAQRAAAGQAGASPAEAGPLPTRPTPPTDPIPPGDVPTAKQIRTLGTFHVLLAFLLMYLLFKAWPPRNWPVISDKGVTPVVYGIEPIYFFKWLKPVTDVFRLPYPLAIWTTLDERLIFLVIVAGALGAYVHATTSFADYVGNRKLTTNWFWWYLLRPFVGIALALIFYFVVRAGFLTGGGDANEINPFGIATLSALAGMFSKQATDKLDEVFTTLFHPGPGKGDEKRGDKLGAPAITNIDPKEGTTEGGTLVTITGTGFANGFTVTFDGVAATEVKTLSATSITAKTPKRAQPGTVTVEVADASGNQKATLTGGYTYKTPPPPTGGPAPETVTTTTTTTTKTTAGGGDDAEQTTDTDTATADETDAEAGDGEGQSEPTGDETTTDDAATGGGGDAAETETTSTETTSATGAGGGKQAAPKISGISPNTGAAEGGVPVVISGSNFAARATVTFDGQEPDKVDVVDDATITLQTPAHEAGTAAVVVKNPDGQSATATFTFV